MKYKVLIIDDELPIRKSLSKIIQKRIPECMVVAEAENGVEGLAKIHDHNPDIIITDIFMPQADGLSMLEKAQPNAKIIVITGFRDFDKARQAISLNVFDLLVKPINHIKLIDTISRAVVCLKTEKLTSLRVLFTAAINDCDIPSIESCSALITSEAKLFASEDMEFVKSYFVKLFDSMQEMRNTIVSSDDNDFSSTEGLKSIIEDSNDIDDLIDVFNISIENIIKNMQQRNVTNISKHIQSAIDYIHDNYSKKISLEDISQHINLSVVHTSRLFKKETGKTVLDYVNEIKLKKAKQMFDTGKYKVYEIADELGFSNSHYFSTLFKKFYGLSPSEYLQNKQNQQD